MTTNEREKRYRILAGLLVGLTPAEPMEDEDQWTELLALAQAERVDLLFHQRVSTLTGLAVPPIVSQILSATYTGGVGASLLYESTRARLCRRLSAHRIPVLLLKGSDLAFTYYDDPATRVMNDLDVLVPMTWVQEASRAVEEDGFTFLSGSRAAALRHAHSHAVCTHPVTGITVELHWELKGLGSVSTAALAEIWSGARQAGFEPNGLVMRAGHLVTYLCAHMALQHKLAYLLHLHDLHRVLLVVDPPEAEVVRDTAIRWGLTSCVGLALRRVQCIFGTPLPGVLETWSAEAANRDDLQAHIAALAFAPGAIEMPNRQLLDLAMGRSELSLLRFLFPSLASIRRHRGLPADAPISGFAYLAHMVGRLRGSPRQLRQLWAFWRAAQAPGNQGSAGSDRTRAALVED